MLECCGVCNKGTTLIPATRKLKHIIFKLYLELFVLSKVDIK